MNEIEVQNHVADYYNEKRYVGLSRKYHFKVISEMMEGLNGAILDVGCGTGIIHDLYPDMDIWGIDVSPGMLRHHKGKHFKCPAEDIMFGDNVFDAVVCRSLLHHLPHPELALDEILRVLKPGGKFVCWETNKSWLATIIRRFTQHGDHFSEYHTAFSDLPSLVGEYFGNLVIKYQGYLGYPIYGFPDILPLHHFFPGLFSSIMWLDSFLSNSPLKKLGFAVMIRATKRED